MNDLLSHPAVLVVFAALMITLALTIFTTYKLQHFAPDRHRYLAADDSLLTLISRLLAGAEPAAQKRRQNWRRRLNFNAAMTVLIGFALALVLFRDSDYALLGLALLAILSMVSAAALVRMQPKLSPAQKSALALLAPSLPLLASGLLLKQLSNLWQGQAYLQMNSPLTGRW